MEVKYQRIDSIDILRGLVILLMALDHTRDFINSGVFNPRDVQQPLLFITRWITHLCAPAFIFLGGMSIYLWQCKHGLQATRIFVLKRGLWLIVLEFTLVKFGWMFNFDTHLFLLQVIWVIGVSLIIMAALIAIAPRLLLIISLVVIAAHNLFDSWNGADFGGLGVIWMLLHEPGLVQLSENSTVFIVYPIIPWVFVMALGYSLFPILRLSEAQSRKKMLYAGFIAIGLFLVVRFINLYGDPTPWQVHDSIVATVLSFIDCEKYPPSLLYLLMTLGPVLILLYLFEQRRYRWVQPLQVFGRVPLFFYVIHLPFIHLITLVIVYGAKEKIDWLFIDPFFAKPQDYGFGLLATYSVWLLVVVLLYPVCVRFGAYKRQSNKGWLRYL